MSETTPLNEWPVEKLYVLQYMVLRADPVDNLSEFECLRFAIDKMELNDLIKSAIKDAEEKLTELPFKP